VFIASRPSHLHVHPDGTEERPQDRPGAAVPVLVVLHPAGADLDICGAIVMDLHLRNDGGIEGIELALDRGGSEYLRCGRALSWL
jgi:hypothetical protein